MKLEKRMFKNETDHDINIFGDTLYKNQAVILDVPIFKNKGTKTNLQGKEYWQRSYSQEIDNLLDNKMIVELSL